MAHSQMLMFNYYTFGGRLGIEMCKLHPLHLQISGGYKCLVLENCLYLKIRPSVSYSTPSSK